MDDFALVFDIQLKRVVFPEFASPMIPHCNAICFTLIDFYDLQNYLFYAVKMAEKVIFAN